ncbi:MAG: dihydrofolate reductase family protein [Bryobacteraceae bacterium]|jgi:riboflavin biosynthesis pyrimidine reductase/LPS sulfotransferase NodH
MPRPFVHINFATAPSGDVADRSGGISCNRDWARVHELRERYDAVAVGAGTWKCDNPRLNVRQERLGREPRQQPLRVVFLGGQNCAVSSASPQTIVIGSGPQPSNGVTYFPSYGHELSGPLDSLRRHGVRTMLVEGGPTLIRSFLQQGVADAVTVYVRCGCVDAAVRAARAVIPEMPPAMRAERFGEGVLLSCAAAPETAVAALKPDLVRFAIIAAPRTGSNMLCTMLNAHPEILCHHELFNPGGIHYALDHRDGQFELGSIEERDRDPAGFLRGVFGHRCGRNAVGFKVNRGQNEIAFHVILTDVTVRKIILRRRNRVKTFVSELIAERTGQWESYEFSDFSRPSPAVEIDANKLCQYLTVTDDYYRGIENRLLSTGQRVLQVTYEDLSSAREQQRILSFLGVSTSVPALIPVTRKRNQADLRSLVSNFDELRSGLKNEELIAQLESAEF